MNQQMNEALSELWERGNSTATPELVLEIAIKYDVETWQLEGFYFDRVELFAKD